MKKIVKIVTFYDDGTFTEATPAVTPVLGPVVSTPFPPINPAPYGPRCAKCGIDTSYPHMCTRTDCPSGFSPWPERTVVQD